MNVKPHTATTTVTVTVAVTAHIPFIVPSPKDVEAQTDCQYCIICSPSSSFNTADQILELEIGSSVCSDRRLFIQQIDVKWRIISVSVSVRRNKGFEGNAVRHDAHVYPAHLVSEGMLACSIEAFSTSQKLGYSGLSQP